MNVKIFIYLRMYLRCTLTNIREVYLLIIIYHENVDTL